MFVILVVLRAQAGAAGCGDGILEYPEEACDEGPANGTDACCSATCQIVDSDGDGICDAYDHYDSEFGFVVDGTAPRPLLRTSGLGATPADTTFRFTGVTTPPTVPFDPVADGLGVHLRAEFIFPDLLDVTLAPGGVWRESARSWSYRDPTGSVGGIVGVRIRRRTGGRLEWQIQGRHLAFSLTPADLLFSGQLRVGLTVAPAVGPSGAAFVAMHWRTPLLEPRCGFDGSGRAVTCRGPQPGPTCQPGDPDAMVRCAVRSAAHSQDLYYARQGTFFTGLCGNLPGYPSPSLPGVVCTTAGGATTFSASAVHPQESFPLGCVWCPDGSPGSNLHCPEANSFSCG